MAEKRFAIVGTAASWKMVPWTDPGLVIAGLNDAYQIPGWVRADRWYDLHPIDHFVYPKDDATIDLSSLPESYYIRPKHHLDWLAKQQIPIFLHPDYRAQAPERLATCGHVRPFPKAEVEARFGRYFSSTPAWMLAHAIIEGFREIQIWGIHLATETEYQFQRPQMEYLIGRFLGAGKIKVTVADGIRRYDTPNGTLVLPMASPVLSGPNQYAFQPRPQQKLDRPKWELQKLHVKRDRVLGALLNRKPWQVLQVPKWREDLSRLEAQIADWQQQLHQLEWQIQDEVVI